MRVQLAAWLIGMSCLFFSGQDVVAQNLADGLEAYWTFDEGAGTVAADSSGNGRDAVFREGEPLWVEGVFGGALEFDGFSDLEVEWYGITGAEPRSVSFWVKSDWLDIPGNNGIVGWGVQEPTRKYHIRFNGDGTIRTEPEGGNNFGTTPLNDEEWHHVVSIFPDGGEVIGDLDHYVDGELEEKQGGLDQFVDTAGEDDGGLTLKIGSRFNGGADGFWVGVIDDLRIYNRELSEEEVLALFSGEGVGGTACDVNGDGLCDAADIDAMTQMVLDGSATREDRTALITNAMPDGFHTYIGDSNLDGEFGSSDLVVVFQSGQFESGQPASWAQGDWDGDGTFGSSDFVAAFQDGGFEQGPRAAISAVPEPSSALLIALGSLAVCRRRRRS